MGEPLNVGGEFDNVPGLLFHAQSEGCVGNMNGDQLTSIFISVQLRQEKNKDFVS